MSKTVIFIFHDDINALSAGSHVAERIRQVKDEQGLELEVFLFGPAQSALTAENQSKEVAEYNQQINELTSNGVTVGACLNAANANGQSKELKERGINLEYARDAFVRFGLESASVISF